MCVWVCRGSATRPQREELVVRKRKRKRKRDRWSQKARALGPSFAVKVSLEFQDGCDVTRSMAEQLLQLHVVKPLIVQLQFSPEFATCRSKNFRILSPNASSASPANQHETRHENKAHAHRHAHISNSPESSACLVYSPLLALPAMTDPSPARLRWTMAWSIGIWHGPFCLTCRSSLRRQNQCEYSHQRRRSREDTHKETHAATMLCTGRCNRRRSVVGGGGLWCAP